MSASSSDLSHLLDRVLAEYPEEQIGEGLSNHETRTDIVARIPERLGDLIDDPELIIKGSVGKGRWTSIPWIAVMDPQETSRTQEGLYIVYLFEPQEGRVRLSLGLGVTELKNDLGMREARNILEQRATRLRTEIDLPGFSPGPVEFPHASSRNKLYGTGTVYYKEYSVGEIPAEDVLVEDINSLVDVYSDLIPTSNEYTGTSTTGAGENDVPTVYQVPIHGDAGQLRTNFEHTVRSGVPRARVAEHLAVPGDDAELRLWGNRAETAAAAGDYLLFAHRNGPHDGEYLLVARVEAATIVNGDVAEEIADAVGWETTPDTTPSHIMFLNPVWRTELDRGSFWSVMGFDGWPNDTYSAIDFERDDGRFDDEYESVRSFVEAIKGDQVYPLADELPPSVDRYDSVQELVEDLRERAQTGERDLAWFRRHLGKALLTDWSEALAGFEPADGVTARVAARCEQISLVYEQLEDELERTADQWGVGRLDDLTPPQTLFLGCLWSICEDLGVDRTHLTPSRLTSILAGTYGDDIGDENAARAAAPLLRSHLDEESPAVYSITAPPEYWLTTYAYACVGLGDSASDGWNEIEPDDIVVFHATAATERDGFADQSGGLVGAGIVRAKSTKPPSAQWWLAEARPDDEALPHLLSFRHLFATGAFTTIDLETDIRSKKPATIEAELEALTRNSPKLTDADGAGRTADTVGGASGPSVRWLAPEQATAVVDAFGDHLTAVPPVAMARPFEGRIDPDRILRGLYFPDGQGEEIVAQIEGALRAGKHTILTGPPGTGKTEIAQRVAAYLAEEYPYLYSGSQMTTATADWSTFDTVGGYMPNEGSSDGGDLEFTPGLVLNRFKDRATNTQRSEPLVVDELNRADIDKAFGQLFTVLSGQSVQLPYTKHGHEVELAPAGDRLAPEPHQYRIPAAWPLFATLNTYDKTSLYEMSYAFMRRFAFIRVPAPQLDGLDDQALRDLLGAYTARWDVDVGDLGAAGRDSLRDVALVWQAANSAIEDRAIGPAVVRDILGYLSEATGIPWERRLTQAVISYVFPQLEGVPKRERVVRKLAAVEAVDVDLLDTAARDMLQVNATRQPDE